MAGTTRGAIKGWITRRRNAGLPVPEFKNDAEMVAWAIRTQREDAARASQSRSAGRSGDSARGVAGGASAPGRRAPRASQGKPRLTSGDRQARAPKLATSPGQTPRVGDSVGGEKITTAERRDAIRKIMGAITERGKTQGGKHVYKLRKALLSDNGRGYDRLIHEYGLTHLNERQRLELLEWMVRNVEPSDMTKGARRAGKGPSQQKKLTAAQRQKLREKLARENGAPIDFGSREVLDDGSVVHEGPGKGGLPDERKATQRPITATDRPGFPTLQFVNRGARELGFGGAKRKKLSQQEIMNPSGPRAKNADPTANRAVRRMGDVPFTDAPMTPGARTGIERRRRDSQARKAVQDMRQGVGATFASDVRRAAEEEQAREEQAQIDREALRNALAAQEAERRKSSGSPRKKPAAKKKPAKKPPAKRSGKIEKGWASSAVRRARARKFREELHRRDMKGRFARKPGAAQAQALKEERKKKLDAMFGPPKSSAKFKGQVRGRKTVGQKIEAAGDAAIKAAYNAPVEEKKPKAKPKVKAAPKPKKEAAPKKPKATKKPAAKKVKAPEKVVAETPAEEPKKTSTPGLKKAGDVDAWIADGDTDAFTEVMKSLKAKDGRVKSLTKNSGNDITLSLSALVEDEKGNRRFLKRTALQPDSGDGFSDQLSGDVHTDIAVTALFNEMGFRSQKIKGFGGDPNDVENASLVMGDVAEDLGGKQTERPLDTAASIKSADWADRKEFVQMMLMDYLTGNTDRHTNNWMEYEDEDGRHIVAIDHSMAGAPSARVHVRAGVVDPWSYSAKESDEDLDDPVGASATRSFRGFMEESYLLSDDGYVATMEIPARVSLLYEGDDEALQADVQEVLALIKKKNPTKVLAKVVKDNGITEDDALDPIADLSYIVEGRLQEAEAGIDEMLESIKAAGSYLKRGGRSKTKVAAKQDEILSWETTA